MFVLVFGYFKTIASFVVCLLTLLWHTFCRGNDRFEVKDHCLMLLCQNLPVFELGTQNDQLAGQTHASHSQCTDVQPILAMSDYRCPMIGRSLIF